MTSKEAAFPSFRIVHPFEQSEGQREETEKFIQAENDIKRKSCPPPLRITSFVKVLAFKISFWRIPWKM